MESWLSIPIVYLLLLFSQLVACESSGGKEDSSFVAGDGFSSRSTNPRDLIRLFIRAQSNYRSPGQAWKPGFNLGIPFRPVRRMGSEFLGKRSDETQYDEDDEGHDMDKRRMGSEFLGKRKMGSEFLGKRGMGSEFLGKRRMGSEFLGKRRMGSEFLGKRGMGSEFLGKRDYDTYPELDHQELPPTLFPRSPNSAMDGEQLPVYLPDGLYNIVGKRAMGSEFLGKRKPKVVDFSWKRGRRLGSEFLGKRSAPAQPELPYPYLRTDRDIDMMNTNVAEKSDENANEN